MEPHQKTYIDEHLLQLAENTNVNSHLLLYLKTKGVLSQAEVDAIKGVNDKFDKNELLYETAKKKKGAFETLKEGLKAAGQTGACAILEEITIPGKSNAGMSASPVNATVSAEGSEKLASSMIVGSPECKISAVVTAIDGSPVGHTFLQDTGKLGLYLDIPSADRKKMAKSEDDDLTKFENMLEIWRKEQGEKATLQALVNAMEQGGKCDEIIHCLEKQFNCQLR